MLGCGKDDNQTTLVTLEDFTTTIAENPTNGDLLGEINYSGPAQDFSISSQTPNGAMMIDANTGQLSVANAALFDFETNPSVTATVQAANSDNTASVVINLTNLGESSLENLTLSVDENPTNNQQLGTVIALQGTATNFAITTQNPDGAMSIDANTGVLTVANAALFDFETNPVLKATVTVDDVATTALVTINLNNIQELSLQDFTVTIDENPTDGQVLGTLQTNGANNLNFTITGQTPAGAVALNTTSGELSVLDPTLFDYEINPTITATIELTDGLETATATATITLNDVDEVSAQNTDLTLSENPTNGDVIGTLQASGSNLTYTITFQNPAGAFAIDANSGQLSVADASLFDFETNPNMLATVAVSNGSQTVSANAFVTLTDLNEIGEYKYGGIIFWIDPNSNNGAGLVCDIDDVPNPNAPSGIPWSIGTNVDTGATEGAIGTGANNTALILTSHSSGDYAAWLCAAHIVGNYSDWYLPSVAELVEISNNLTLIDATAQANGGAPFAGMYHWSSTEVNTDAARIIINNNGTLSATTQVKNNSGALVRAVRSWTN